MAMADTATRRRRSRLPDRAYATKRRIEGWLLALPTLVLILGLSIFPLHLTRWCSAFNAGICRARSTRSSGWRTTAMRFSIARLGCAAEHGDPRRRRGRARVPARFGTGAALGRRFRRASGFAMPILMLPVMMVPVVVGLTWRMLWDNQYGAVNQVLGSIAGHDVNIIWLAHRDTAIIAMTVTEVWQWTPFMFLILLAATLRRQSGALRSGRARRRRLVAVAARCLAAGDRPRHRGRDPLPRSGRLQDFRSGLHVHPGRPRHLDRNGLLVHLSARLQVLPMGYASAVSYIVVILLTIVATLYVARFLRGRRA